MLLLPKKYEASAQEEIDLWQLFYIYLFYMKDKSAVCEVYSFDVWLALSDILSILTGMLLLRVRPSINY